MNLGITLDVTVPAPDPEADCSSRADSSDKFIANDLAEEARKLSLYNKDKHDKGDILHR